MGRKIDWAYVQDSLKDIQESTEALNKWDRKDINEFNFHDMIISISLENIKAEMGIK